MNYSPRFTAISLSRGVVIRAGALIKINDGLLARGINFNTALNNAIEFRVSVMLRKRGIYSVPELLANIKEARIDNDWSTLKLFEKGLMAANDLAYNSMSEKCHITLDLDVLRTKQIIKNGTQDETRALLDPQMEIEDMVPIFVKIGALKKEAAVDKTYVHSQPMDRKEILDFMDSISMNEIIQNCYFYKTTLKFKGVAVNNMTDLAEGIEKNKYNTSRFNLNCLKTALTTVTNVARANKKKNYIFVVNLELLMPSKFTAVWLERPDILEFLGGSAVKEVFKVLYENGIVEMAKGKRAIESDLPGMRQVPRDLLYPEAL